MPRRHADNTRTRGGAGAGGRREERATSGAPLVAHVDVACLLVEEAELGFLLSWLSIVRLLLALRLATNPRHGWPTTAAARGPLELTILYRSAGLAPCRRGAALREKKRSITTRDQEG